MSMTQLLFSFEGRLNRKPWWLTNIAVGVDVTVLLLLALAMVGEHKFTEAFLTMALLIILYIPLLWVSLALGAKRLHDRELGCLRGTVGPNRYGPDPLGPVALGPAGVPGPAR